MRALANLHGQMLPLEDVKISALDRGFLFGDAVYEVLRVYAARPWLEAEHFRRLAHSLEAIRIQGVDLDRLQRRMRETLKASGAVEATIYIQITRGAAPRKHPFPKQATPLELLWVQEFQDPYGQARQEGGAVLSQPDLRWHRCDIKSVNLLANVLASQAAAEAGCVEAILYQPNGVVTEGTHTSLFAVSQGSVLATPQDANILPGITRGLVLSLAERAGVPVRQQEFRLDGLPHMEELFLTGTTTEVMPIIRLDGQPIGPGQPGPITRKLQAAYAEAVREFLGKTT